MRYRFTCICINACFTNSPPVTHELELSTAYENRAAISVEYHFWIGTHDLSQTTGRCPIAERHTGEGAVICIPTYNERENLPRAVPAVLEAVPAAHVLIIDDNSPDGTGALADEIAAKDSRVEVMHRAERQGLGKAYLAGFVQALERGYKYVFEFDADFSHDPRYLPGFIQVLADGADRVVGSRRIAGGGVEIGGSSAASYLGAAASTHDSC
jgi:Glycosyl transferase family 2